MAQAYIDRIDDLSFVERLGNIRSLTRKIRVLFPPMEIPGDFTVLSQALTAAGVPPIMSTLNTTNYKTLVLVERQPRLTEDIGCVDVILKYEHILDGPNQVLLQSQITPSPIPNPQPILYGRGRCSVIEKTTNFYYPFGDQSLGRVEILVGHTFPTWETGVAALPFDPRFPRTVVQAGEITIPFPQGNFTMNGVIQTTNPWALANQIVATINSVEWMQKPEFTWLCSECQFEIIDIEQLVYRFQFEFQYNFDTWNPTVVFNDQRTGRPPFNVVLGSKINDGTFLGQATPTIEEAADEKYPKLPSIVSYQPYLGTTSQQETAMFPAGYWTVPALQPIDFNQFFSAIFEGAVAPLIA